MPGVTGDSSSVELVTRRLRVVTKPTSEARAFGERVAEAYRKAKARPAPPKAPRAYRPSNTLGQGSRPAPAGPARGGGGGGGGGKRSKLLMAAAAAAGGGGGGDAGGAGGGMRRGAVSSGRVRRRQDSDDEVEEVEEPRGRRSDGREQVRVGGGGGKGGEGECCVDARPRNQL